MIILPRQARDKHKESTQKETRFLIGYRRDVETVDLDELTRMVNEKIGDRGVPVITFVFGGGPGTIQTAMESMANNNPIIIAAGSGRCADLIAEWTDMYKHCLLYTSPSPRDGLLSRMPSSA